MLVEIPYLVGAEYVPPGKRRPRHEYMRVAAAFEIAEMDGGEVPAYAIRDALELPDPTDRPPIVAWHGELYWPVLDQAFDRPVRLDDWLRRSGDASFVECPSAYDGGDILGVGAMLEESRRLVAERDDDPRYPGRTLRMDLTRPFSELDAGAKLIRTTEDVARAHLDRAVAALALRDGVLYRRRGEPVLAISGVEWPRLDVLDAAEVPAWRPPPPAWRRTGDPLVPFAEYDLFRADRGADALRKVAEFELYGQKSFGPESRVLEPLGGHVPSFEASALMLARAGETLRRTIAHERELAAGRSATGIAAVDRIHEDRARLLEGLPDPAAAADQTAWGSVFREVAARLRELSAHRVFADGAAHRRIEHMLREAHQRAVRDRAAGLLPETAFSEEDEAALGALAL